MTQLLCHRSLDSPSHSLRRHLIGDDLEDVDGDSVDHSRKEMVLSIVRRGQREIMAPHAIDITKLILFQLVILHG